MNYYEASLKMHEKLSGKLEIKSKAPLVTKEDLSIAYTPGVAQPCLEIEKKPEEAYRYTIKKNMVAVISDGSSVLGLGNIGGLASLPVMEGKAILFKEFGEVDAFPICLDTQDTEEIINIIRNIAPTFGGINLEDISAPRCFEIEKRLQEILDIPVFHDDQHGTATVVAAALINSLKLLGKNINEAKVLINGAGAAGNAILEMLLALGVKDIIVCDSKGVISTDRLSSLTEEKINILEKSNKNNVRGSLKDGIEGRNVFIGVSRPKTLTAEMVRSMDKDPIIFAMSNPEPEIMPNEAKAAGAAVIGTGRSDFPNQINNVLVFPGIFKGALLARAKKITQDMKVAAAYALSEVIKEEDLTPEYILPDVFNKNVATVIADAVSKAWQE